MVDTFTPRVGADTSSSTVDETSHEGRSRTPVRWGQGIPQRPSMTPSHPANSESRPSTSRNISQASVSEAISRLQREKANIQQKLDGVLETHKDLGQRFVKLTQERDHLARQNDEQKQSIQNLHKELGGDAELDGDDDDDEYTLRIKRDLQRPTTGCYIILGPTTFDSHGPSCYHAIIKGPCDGRRDSTGPFGS